MASSQQLAPTGSAVPALTATDRQRLFGSDSDSDSDSSDADAACVAPSDPVMVDAGAGVALDSGEPAAAGSGSGHRSVAGGGTDQDVVEALVHVVAALAPVHRAVKRHIVLRREIAVVTRDTGSECGAAAVNELIKRVAAGLRRADGAPVVSEVPSTDVDQRATASTRSGAGVGSGAGADAGAGAAPGADQLLPDLAGVYDVVVDAPCGSLVCGGRAVVSGGSLVIVGTARDAASAVSGLDTALWEASSHVSTAVGTVEGTGELVAVVVRRRVVVCNTTAVAWAATGDAAVDAEQARIAAVAVPRSVAERRAGCLSDASLVHAVRSMEVHGMVILPGLAPEATVRLWGGAALRDFEEVHARLQKRGINLLRPGTGPAIENYHELGMRQAFRCDLRHTPHMRATEPRVGSTARDNEVVQQIVRVVCDPPGAKHAAGNWGRWNFEGGGPQAPKPPLVVCPAGAVMSLPGAQDQLVHADTPHLYEHVHLPPHYLNFFFPAAAVAAGEANPGGGGNSEAAGTGDSLLAVGQTAFLLGTHRLEASEACMDNPRGEGAGLRERQRRLIRPHLALGDALLFDVRLLHFGLANASATVRRPVLYVNWHQPWWARERVDKNFTKESLFVDAARPPAPAAGMHTGSEPR